MNSDLNSDLTDDITVEIKAEDYCNMLVFGLNDFTVALAQLNNLGRTYYICTDDERQQYPDIPENFKLVLNYKNFNLPGQLAPGDELLSAQPVPGVMASLYWNIIIIGNLAEIEELPANINLTFFWVAEEMKKVSGSNLYILNMPFEFDEMRKHYFDDYQQSMFQSPVRCLKFVGKNVVTVDWRDTEQRRVMIVVPIADSSARMTNFLASGHQRLKDYCERYRIELVWLNRTKMTSDNSNSQMRRSRFQSFLLQHHRAIIISEACLVEPTCPDIFNLVPEDRLGYVAQDPVDCIESIAEPRLERNGIVVDKKVRGLGLLVLSQCHRRLLEELDQINPDISSALGTLHEIVKINDPIKYSLGRSYCYPMFLPAGSSRHRNANSRPYVIDFETAENSGDEELANGEKLLTQLKRVQARVDKIINNECNYGVKFERFDLVDLMTEIVSIRNCNLLIFGLSQSSILWNSTNQAGSTFFVENRPFWYQQHYTGIAESNKIFHSYEGISVGSSSGLSIEQLEAFPQPDIISLCNWDMVIIEGPQGYSPKLVGRALPIYWTSKLRQDNPDLMVFMNDHNRSLENSYCHRFFSGYPHTIIKCERDIMKVERHIAGEGPLSYEAL